MCRCLQRWWRYSRSDPIVDETRHEWPDLVRRSVLPLTRSLGYSDPVVTRTNHHHLHFTAYHRSNVADGQLLSKTITTHTHTDTQSNNNGTEEEEEEEEDKSNHSPRGRSSMQERSREREREREWVRLHYFVVNCSRSRTTAVPVSFTLSSPFHLTGGGGQMMDRSFLLLLLLLLHQLFNCEVEWGERKCRQH